MRDIAIYFSGGINKGKNDSNKTLLWSENDIEKLRMLLDSVKLISLNPLTRNDDLSDSLSVFGRDLMQVYLADIIVVDGREKRGIGVGSEMLFAKVLGTPLITICPEESHYNRRDLEFLGQQIDHWIHPFIEAQSDYICSTIEEVADYINKNIIGLDNTQVKNKDYIDKAMLYYYNTQLERDKPMLNLMKASEKLKTKVEKLQEAYTRKD